MIYNNITYQENISLEENIKYDTVVKQLCESDKIFDKMFNDQTSYSFEDIVNIIVLSFIYLKDEERSDAFQLCLKSKYSEEYIQFENKYIKARSNVGKFFALLNPEEQWTLCRSLGIDFVQSNKMDEIKEINNCFIFTLNLFKRFLKVFAFLPLTQS